MPRFYVEFKTWAEGRVETPWDFVLFGELPEYRARGPSGYVVPEHKVRSIFLSMDPTECGRFLSNHVSASLVGAVIEAADEADLSRQIGAFFNPCQLVGSFLVTDENTEMIKAVMENAGDGPSPA